MAWLLFGSIVAIGLSIIVGLYFGIVGMNAAFGTMVE